METLAVVLVLEVPTLFQATLSVSLAMLDPILLLDLRLVCCVLPALSLYQAHPRVTVAQQDIIL